MSVLTKDIVKSKVKDILPIDDTNMYNEQLDILVSGAISKLSHEGIPIDVKDKDGNYIFNVDNDIVNYDGNDYIICVSYQIMKDMDYDINMDFMTEQYITRIGTLRCSILAKQH